MPRGKHTRCSSCRSLGEHRYLELMWRFKSRSPWHYVGGWLCVPCRTALLQLVESVGSPVIAWDG